MTLSFARRLTCICILFIFPSIANAQTEIYTIADSPYMWSTFNGTTTMGPYRWVAWPELSSASGQNMYPVLASTIGSTLYFVCHATLSDGVHPGKFYLGVKGPQCSIGWGGQEVVKTDAYEILVNTRPDLAPFLAQKWISPTSYAVAETFTGGKVPASGLRVCKAAMADGWHPGKEWQGACNIAYNGKEVAGSSYVVLKLDFDAPFYKTAMMQQPFFVSESPVVVGSASYVNAQNGLWMKTKSGNCVGSASPSPYPLPRDVIAKPGTTVGPRGSAADCFDNPATWFVTDARPLSWYRIRRFDTSVCLTAIDGKEPAFRPCDESRSQLWKFSDQGFMMSGLTPDYEPVTTSTLFRGKACPGEGTYVVVTESSGLFSVRLISATMVGFDSYRCNYTPTSMTLERAGAWHYTTNIAKRNIP